MPRAGLFCSVATCSSSESSMSVCVAREDVILAAVVAATRSALCLGASADEIENAVYDGMQVAQRISMMFAFEVGNENLEMQQHADCHCG